MSNIREKGRFRFGGVAAVSAVALIAAISYSSFAASPRHLARDVTLTSLTVKESSVVGGDMNPVHLDIAFTGTPAAGDVVRLRPEKNDAAGWKTTEPLKQPDPTKVHVTFNQKDDTGPYIDVPITGTSPVSVTIETANPDMTRKDTFITGKVGAADGVDSSKLSIVHDAGK